MRTLGFATGIVVLVVAAALAVAAVLSSSNQTAWTDLEVGDCFDLAAAIDDAEGDLAELMAVDTQACDEPHDAEVVAVGELNPDRERDYPADEQLFAEIDAACSAMVPDAVDPATFGIVPIGPDERTWDGRAGRFACVAVVIGGGTVTGSSLD